MVHTFGVYNKCDTIRYDTMSVFNETWCTEFSFIIFFDAFGNGNHYYNTSSQQSSVNSKESPHCASMESIQYRWLHLLSFNSNDIRENDIFSYHFSLKKNNNVDLNHQYRCVSPIKMAVLIKM